VINDKRDDGTGTAIPNVQGRKGQKVRFRLSKMDVIVRQGGLVADCDCVK